MSIGGIQGRDLSTIRDQMQSFQQGKTNLQKSDLSQIQSKLDGAGHSLEAAGIGELVDSFGKIDQNGDGMSAQELQSYVKGKEGAAPASPQTQAPDASSQASPFQGMRGGGRPLSISIELEMSGPRRMPQGGQGESGGSGGISKEDLEALKQKLEESGMEVPQGLEDLLSSFDETDGNSDGKLDLKELLEKLFQGKGSGSTANAATGDESAASESNSEVGGNASVTLKVSSTTISAGRTGASEQSSSAEETDTPASTDATTTEASTGSASTTSASAAATTAETKGTTAAVPASDETNSDSAASSASDKRIDWRSLFKQDQGNDSVHPSSEGSRAPGVYQRYISSYTQVSFAMSSSSFQTRA